MVLGRSRRKPWDVKIRIERPLQESVRIIAQTAGCTFSECVDALLLLTEAQYTESSGDELIFVLLELKGKRILNIADIRAKAPRVSCHVMLSAKARDFATLLYESYPPVFGSTNEAIDLCLAYWQRCCESRGHLEYVARRLSRFVG